MPPRCHGHRICRPEPYSLYVTIFPVAGGPKVAGGTTRAHCWDDSEATARDLITTVAQANELQGEFVATWRHCYGREPVTMTRFTAAPAAQPIEVTFE